MDDGARRRQTTRFLVGSPERADETLLSGMLDLLLFIISSHQTLVCAYISVYLVSR